MSNEPERPLRLFEAIGIELEYMLVDRQDLKVRPVADEVLKAVTGAYQCDFEEGSVAWSNELVMHVIELKMNGPGRSLAGWAERFQADVRRIDNILEPQQARLLPGAMHPSMDPRTETTLWRHEYSEVYAAYNRIFDCRRHGWANLQSCHVNLPFRGDQEFRRLHAAIRVLLPLLPALAASSPLMDGAASGYLDSRLHVYCTHQARIPAAMGQVIPELVQSQQEYVERILQPIYAAIAPHDPDGVLQHEFLNARGAIARFERNAIEIRLLDVQEQPRADLAIALLVTATVRALVEERLAGLADQEAMETAELVELLHRNIRDAERAEIREPAFAALFGLRAPVSAGAIWRHLAGRLTLDDPAWSELSATLEAILEQGPLARRLLGALGDRPAPEQIRQVYLELADCLRTGRLFGV